MIHAFTYSTLPGMVGGRCVRYKHKLSLTLTRRARINEERIFNRIDSNRLLFMNRLKVDSIWWKNTALGSIGKPRIVLEIL